MGKENNLLMSFWIFLNKTTKKFGIRIPRNALSLCPIKSILNWIAHYKGFVFGKI